MSDPASHDQRIQDVLDGIGGNAERAVLISSLADDAEARRIYLEYVYLEMALEYAEAEVAPSAAIGNVIPMDRVLARQKRRNFRWAMVAAVIALLAAGIAGMFITAPEPPVASFTVSPRTQFQITHSLRNGESEPKGNALAIGSRIQLSRGALELNISRGVNAIVRSPADFTLQDELLVNVAYGSAWFEVEPGASGFQVETPELLLTDLGTEFGIVSKQDAPDEVHIFSGKVVVINRRRPEVEVGLVAGEARVISADGWEEVKFGPDGFFTRLPKVDLLPPHLHWKFDEVGAGGEIATGGTMPDTNDIQMRLRAAGQGPVQTIGRVRGALAFDTSGDGLVSNWRGIAGDHPRTIAFWLKLPEELPNYDATLLAWGKMATLDANSEWFVRATAYDYTKPKTARTQWTEITRIQLHFGGSWFVGSTDLARGRWHHVAICYGGELDSSDRPKVNFYLNGRPEEAAYYQSWDAYGAPLNTITDLPGANPLVVGSSRSSPDASCGATLDELYIFDSKLSPEAVRALANP